MFIADGYTGTAELDGDYFAYRPITRQERVLLRETLSTIPDLLGERIERRIVESRIVYSTWGCTLDCFHDETYERIRDLAFGIGRTKQEIEDEKNLYDGVRLVSRYPHFRKIDCDYCRKWHINPKTGTRIIQHYSDPTQPRPDGSQLLCEVGECPRGHWSNPVALSPKNETCYRHYRLFRQGPPQDSIVAKNWEIIRRAESDSTVDG